MTPRGRSTPKRGRETAPRKAKPPARAGSRRAGLLLVGIAVAAAAAFAWWRGIARPEAPAAPADSSATLDGPAALREAIARVDRGQRLKSLPFFERALERGTGREGQVVSLYAAVLQDVALDSTVRSSVERAEILQRALQEIERVAARTSGPEQRAAFIFQHSYILRVVGFPIDAMVELNLAAGEHPGEAMIDGARYGLAMRLRTPEDPAR